MTYLKMKVCPKCGGSGWYPSIATGMLEKCSLCEGIGRVIVSGETK